MWLLVEGCGPHHVIWLLATHYSNLFTLGGSFPANDMMCYCRLSVVACGFTLDDLFTFFVSTFSSSLASFICVAVFYLPFS